MQGGFLIDEGDEKMSPKKSYAIWTMVVGLACGTTVSAKEVKVTGTVGDAMCGTKHMMKGDDAGCTQGCVKKGSDYALIIKDKVYTLKTASDEMKTQLDKLAGHRANIEGDQDGDTIQVTSVRAAK
jgi:hypothetical protein